MAKHTSSLEVYFEMAENYPNGFIFTDILNHLEIKRRSAGLASNYLNYMKKYNLVKAIPKKYRRLPNEKMYIPIVFRCDKKCSFHKIIKIKNQRL